MFNIINLNGNFKNEDKCVLVLGDFDGVHTGHRKLISCAKAIAKEKGIKVGVYTFCVNTKSFLGTADLCRLTTDNEKNRIFSELGVDFVCYDDFSQIKEFSPEDFCCYITEKFNIESVVCGENYTFGKGAKAGSEDLEKIMSGFGVLCYIVEMMHINNECVSSTTIRESIKSGDVEKAALMLGYRYFINAEIIHGAELGRKLGFPTINQLDYDSKCIPKFGVYVCVCTIDDRKYMAVSNVGVKPTVTESADNPPVVFETHVIDYSGDLYGKYVKVEFCKMLRAEKKFNSLDDLHDNVMLNINQTKELFDKGVFDIDFN